MLTRLIDFLKSHGRTALLTGLKHGNEPLDSTAVGISSLIDTWIELRDMEFGGERNRTLYVSKARGMAHSNQVREFLIGGNGIRLVDVCLGPEGVLTGSARVAYEMRLHSGKAARERKEAALQRQLQSRKAVMESRIAAMQAELEAEVYAIESTSAVESQGESRAFDERIVLADIRNKNGAASARPEEVL
jgi:circadian clock protein KaiC